MMSFEGPIIAAVVARMANPKTNLAGYGIAFAIALVIEAPIMSMFGASTTLVRGRESLRRLNIFNHIMNISLTIILGIILIPSIFNVISEDLLRLEIEVRQASYWGLVGMLPWPAAIGYRRYWQGLLVSRGKTRLIAFGTAFRLITLFLMIAILRPHLDGAFLAGCCLGGSVVIEMFAIRWFARDAISYYRQTTDTVPTPTWGSITRFYWPLALTSVVTLSVSPIVTFFLSQGLLPLESLAVWPVASACIFFFRAFGLSYHEAAIALLSEDSQNNRVLRRLAYIMAATIFFILAIALFTPLGVVIMSQAFGLSPDLVDVAIGTMLSMLLFPVSTVWINWQRAILIYHRITLPLTWAGIIEVIGVAATLFLGISASKLYQIHWAGSVFGGIGLMAGRLASCIFLHAVISTRGLETRKNPTAT